MDLLNTIAHIPVPLASCRDIIVSDQTEVIVSFFSLINNVGG